ncbi:unannotated protein [freshwater metagenome]|uniref:Unannotated protein n=1 Tax=freshwater metagenome TaxID=449393 RepID=A0A6J7GYE1_9ZZZZ
MQRAPAGLLRAGIYVRLSLDASGEGHGVARQEVECRAYVERRGWAVAHVYADNDTGAFTGKRRPGYEAMLHDLRQGAIGAVVIWHVDRLTRRPLELETFIDLCEQHGVELGTVQGEIDLATPGGRLFARQLGAFARYEQEHKAERLRASNRQQALSGRLRRGGGVRAFGYETDGMTIREDEARVLRDCAQRIIDGESLRSVVRSLNERKVLTSAGNAWSGNALKRMLSNPRLIAKRTYNGEVVADGEWPPILTPEVQEKVVARLWNAERTAAADRTGYAPRRYLLGGGLLVCGLCGTTLKSQPTRRRDGTISRGYTCRSDQHVGACGRIRIAADLLEEEVAARVLARLASPSVRKRLQAAGSVAPSGDDGSSLAEHLQSLDSKLAALGRDYGDGLIDRSAFLAAQTRLQQRQADARAQLQQLARLQQLPAADPAALAQWWADATIERRRDLVSAVLDHIVVGPATKRGPRRTLDDDRLTWLWR